MFFGVPKEVGGSFGCHILAQRWYGTPFHFRRTYIHIYIYTYVYIYIYTYIHTYIHACIQPGPGETIINQICLAEIFLGVGWGAPLLFEIFRFLPPHPKGGIHICIYIYTYNYSIYIQLHICICIYIYVYMYICMRMYMLHMYVYLCVHYEPLCVFFSPWQRLTPGLQ